MQDNNFEVANYYSLKCFLNSYLRDYENELNLERNGNSYQINQGGKNLIVKIDRPSLVGKHCYGKVYEISDEGREKEISFEKLINSFNEQTEMVESSLLSRDFIKRTLEAKEKAREKKYDYMGSESDFLLGHPFHPYPKCKKGIEGEDLVSYSPELSEGFFLQWLFVKKYITKGAMDENIRLKEILFFDCKESEPDGYLCFPMHPWQWRQLLKRADIQDYLKNAEIVEGPRGKKVWKALSSMRSLYCKGAPFLLKFSLSLKITNSMRDLEINETIRGVQIEKVLQTKELQVFFKNYSSFYVLREPEFLSLRDKAGEVITSSIVQVRENFPESFNLNSTYLLAGLLEESPHTEKSERLKSLVSYFGESEGIDREVALRKWFAEFLKVVIEPFLVLAGKYGILLGGHAQNIIITCSEKGLPLKVVFRDCQGTGFTSKGYEAFSSRFPFINKENGNILNDEDVNKVFLYYLVVNTVFLTINALSENDQEEERKLLGQFRTFLYPFYTENKKEYFFIDFLLNSKFLYQKGNFRCSLENINEATDSDPWRIYNKITNPLKKELRPLRVYPVDKNLYQHKLKRGGVLSFRKIDLNRDLNTFYNWHHKEFVKDFWELDKSKNKLKKYLDKLIKSPYQLPLIFEVNGDAAGYFELYWAFDDRIAPYCSPLLHDRGIHLLIGEEKYLNRSYAFESLKHISHFMFQDCLETQNIWGEPRSDNKKILKLAEALPGWRYVKDFSFPHKEAALLQCSREMFYKEFSLE